jgi:hypothetical protein
LVGRVTDDTPASLEYGDYRGWVEFNAHSGEWLRDISDETHDGMTLGDPIYSAEYTDLRPVICGQEGDTA